MGTENIGKREEELVHLAFDKLLEVKNLHILADNVRERLGVISFYILGIHYNLLVKILNDRFGIQVRGGCACAGTYGHYLLDVSYEHSREITDKINTGDLSEKPGWVRLSLHPTMTNEELDVFVNALHMIVENIDEWEQDYIYNKRINEFRHKDEPEDKTVVVEDWFEL